jgi:hypothetical protein
VADVEGLTTMVDALHRGRVRRRPKVNQVEDEGMKVDGSIVSLFEQRGRKILVL